MLQYKMSQIRRRSQAKRLTAASNTGKC